MTNVNTVTIEAMEAQLAVVNQATATLNEMFAAFKAQSVVTTVVESTPVVTETVELSDEERNAIVRKDIEEYVANTTFEPLLDESEEDEEEEVKPTLAQMLEKAEAEIKLQEAAQEAEAEKESEEEFDAEYSAELEWEMRGEQEYVPSEEEIAEYMEQQSKLPLEEQDEQYINICKEKAEQAEKAEEDVESTMQDMQDAGAVQSLANELTKQAPEEVKEEVKAVAPKKTSILDKVKLDLPVVAEVSSQEIASEMAAFLASQEQQEEAVEEVQQEQVKEEVSTVEQPTEETSQEVVEETTQSNVVDEESVKTESEAPETKEEAEEVKQPVNPASNVRYDGQACVIAAPMDIKKIANSGRLSKKHESFQFIREAAHALQMTILGMVNRGVKTFHISEMAGMELYIFPFAWKEVIKQHKDLELVVFTNNDINFFQAYYSSLEEEKQKGVYSPRRMAVGLRTMATKVVDMTSANAWVLRQAAAKDVQHAIHFMPEKHFDRGVKLYKDVAANGVRVQISPWTLLAARYVGNDIQVKQFKASMNYAPAMFVRNARQTSAK